MFTLVFAAELTSRRRTLCSKLQYKKILVEGEQGTIASKKLVNFFASSTYLKSDGGIFLISGQAGENPPRKIRFNAR